MGFFGTITWPFRKIYGAFKKLFNTEAGRTILTTFVDQLLPSAIPIVQMIQDIIKSPRTATKADIYALYEHFGVAFDEFEDSIRGRRQAVQDLAVALLSAKYPQIDDMPLLKAAIELALSKIQAEEKL